MKQYLFSVLDGKVGSWSRPFCEPTSQAAVRMVISIIRDGDNLLAKFPSDYSLWEVGQFDDETGEVSGYRPVLVRNVGELAEELILAQIAPEQPRLKGVA